jgi:mono/diheme cytochrome c family protein
MNLRVVGIPVLSSVLALAGTGCHYAPGKPVPGSEEKRPDQVLDFATLYAQNCAACHGEQGKNGAALSLANPVYLDVAGTANILRITAEGVPGTMMPPFARAKGGMLTEQQIAALVQGMVREWGTAALPAGQTPPSYASNSAGVAANGQRAFATFCARCHGADGAGALVNSIHVGSLVDPAYLSLISDQGLRSITIAGQPEQGMPDWRSDAAGNGARPTTDEEITDIVAWIAAHRIATPGEPYPQKP